MTPSGPGGTEARRPMLVGWVLAIVCIAAGALFFASLGRLWPLADLELLAPSAELREQAREFLEQQGFDLEGYRSASALTVDTRALDYVERASGVRRPSAGSPRATRSFDTASTSRSAGNARSIGCTCIPRRARWPGESGSRTTSPALGCPPSRRVVRQSWR